MKYEYLALSRSFDKSVTTFFVLNLHGTRVLVLLGFLLESGQPIMLIFQDKHSKNGTGVLTP